MHFVAFVATSNYDRIFRDYNMVECFGIPTESSRSISAHKVADLLKGIVEKTTVTKHSLFVLVRNCINDRADLGLEVDELVDLFINMALQIYDLINAP